MVSQITTLFDSCTPHDDVLSGTLSENEFAAKLSDVVFKQEKAPEIYADPDTFFTKTYATDGLQDLLTLLAKRYSGMVNGEFSGQDGLLSLDTVFGGGKTHSQIAAYHFSQNPDAIKNLEKYIPDAEARAEFEGQLSEPHLSSLYAGLRVAWTPISTECQSMIREPLSRVCLR